MTKKHEVDLPSYRKAPRLLPPDLENALGAGGGLRGVLERVKQDDQLRLEIRDGRFNVYYGGGSLLNVDARKDPWEMRFDREYFRGSAQILPNLPRQFRNSADSVAWVNAFQDLMKGMDAWRQANPRDERRHCQEMAKANSARAGPPSGDFCVLDLEYQWAQRRFDLIAARRRPTTDESTGWTEPSLVFIEVKSDERACTGPSGLAGHARDYQSIVEAPPLQAERIREEFEAVIQQKRRLGLVHRDWPFQRFSLALPLELLIVFVGLKPRSPKVSSLLAGVNKVLDDLGDCGDIRFLRLEETDYVMRISNTLAWKQLTKSVQAGT